MVKLIVKKGKYPQAGMQNGQDKERVNHGRDGLWKSSNREPAHPIPAPKAVRYCTLQEKLAASLVEPAPL